MKKIAIDCELQGLDFQHGSRPFLVTICEDGQEPVFWEWPIDPLTRQPVIEDVSDLHTIIGIINSADTIIGQNIKTEAHALYHLCKDHGIIFNWPWEKAEDTLMAGHLLASNRKHDLTSMVTEYLHINMDSYEEAVKKASQKARRMARRDNPQWRIAKKGEEDNPSAKDTLWHSDMWLPRCLATVNNYDKNHEWWTVTSEYANADSFFTYQLWEAMEKEIKKRQLWKIYRYRMRLLPIATGLERRGATINGVELQKMIREFGEEADRLGEVCENIAASYDYELVLPKSGANNSLRQFCFGTEDEDGPLNLPVLKWTPSGQPSLDKEALEAYLVRLPRNSKQLLFVKSLRDKGKRDKAVTMMESYEKYWKPYTNGDGESNTGTTKINGDYQGWYVLYGSANPTGTDTLRWSFSNPNLANVSRQEGFNARRAFGPAPGREWWPMDAENLELRIPAFEAGEKDAIYVFEHPEEPPYFGSYHLLVLDLLYPHLFREYGKKVKTNAATASTYTRVKSGNFAVIYGCQKAKADATYGVDGAFWMMRHRFPNIAKLSDKLKAMADKLGYVTTIPDKSVDPARGYPILCTRTEFGRVMPTVPLNYFVQPTAMQWTNSAMIKCDEKLESWRQSRFDAFITLQVHDEIVFDFPRSQQHPKVDPKRSNLWRAKELQRLMMSCGDDIGVPTPVSISYCTSNWAELETI